MSGVTNHKSKPNRSQSHDRLNSHETSTVSFCMCIKVITKLFFSSLCKWLNSPGPGPTMVTEGLKPGPVMVWSSPQSFSGLMDWTFKLYTGIPLSFPKTLPRFALTKLTPSIPTTLPLYQVVGIVLNLG